MNKYSELLSMKWEEIMMSDFAFKSNAMRHIIEMKGREIDSEYGDSDIIIFYNIGTGDPMVFVERIQMDKLVRTPEESEFDLSGFMVNIGYGGEDERSYVEIVITKADLYSALSMQ